MPGDPSPADLAVVAGMLEAIEALTGTPTEWGGGPQPDGRMQLNYAIPAPAAEKLRDALYHRKLILYGFHWGTWSAEAESFRDPATLATATLDDLRKLFTYHVRKDRFVEGHYAGVIEDGHMAALLRRLRELL
jgi:hypothetical protein